MPSEHSLGGLPRRGRGHQDRQQSLTALDTCLNKNDATPGTGNLVANGLKEGQYTAPTFGFIFPANVKPGDLLIPYDFRQLPFLRFGEGATTPSVLDPGVGPLEPAPW